MLLEPKNRQSNSYASREFNLYSTALSCKFSSKTSRKTKFKHKVAKPTVKESFFMEFADEIDIFSVGDSFPDWVYRFREDRLGSIERDFRRMCRKLKDSGFSFFIHYPVEIGGKWKFADVYIPKTGTVVLLGSFGVQMHSPCNVVSERERWFSSRYRTVTVYPDELGEIADRVSV